MSSGLASLTRLAPAAALIYSGAEIMVRMAQLDADGRTGGYFDVNGPVPW